MADKIKFSLALIILAAGVAGFYLLSEQAMILRVLAVLVGFALAMTIAWKTEQGQRFFVFANEAVVEAQKSCLAEPQGNHADDGNGVRVRRGDGYIPLSDR